MLVILLKHLWRPSLKLKEFYTTIMILILLLNTIIIHIIFKLVAVMDWHLSLKLVKIRYKYLILIYSNQFNWNI